MSFESWTNTNEQVDYKRDMTIVPKQYFYSRFPELNKRWKVDFDAHRKNHKIVVSMKAWRKDIKSVGSEKKHQDVKQFSRKALVSWQSYNNKQNHFDRHFWIKLVKFFWCFVEKDDFGIKSYQFSCFLEK